MSQKVFQNFAVFVPGKISFVPEKLQENPRMAPEKYGMYVRCRFEV